MKHGGRNIMIWATFMQRRHDDWSVLIQIWMYGVYVQWNSGQNFIQGKHSGWNVSGSLKHDNDPKHIAAGKRKRKKATPKAFQHDTHQFTKTLTSWICMYLFEYCFLQLKCWNITDHTQLFQVENLHKSDRRVLFQPTVIFRALHCFKCVL